MVIGRKREREEMTALLADKRAHLLAVIGRRRVGKTYLIRAVYKKHKVFEMTGLKDADLQQQLTNFTLQMNAYFPSEAQFEQPVSWLLAFNMLSQSLRKTKSTKKQVVFFDEVPWIASKRSGFTEALGHWWNNWASQQNIIVVLCGSAASWMLEHVVNAKGGLYNRISKLITLMPFTLKETKSFLKSRQVQVSDYQIVQLYMTMGGIPHYLEQVKRGRSAAQNIQSICFEKDGVLRLEFENLYPALFDNAKNHIKIIKALAGKSRGLDRQEILTKTSMTDGGWFSGMLDELYTSGFISKFQPLENKKKETLYRLTDEYSLFYLHFMDGKSRFHADEWLKISQQQRYKIWCGYAFENLCMKHSHSIKAALGISGIHSADNSFVHKKNRAFSKGFQIDLLIDRNDHVINICEMKFYANEFSISPAYAKILRTKKEGLRTVTATKKELYLTFISPYGIMDNHHKLDLVDHDLKIDIFF